MHPGLLSLTLVGVAATTPEASGPRGAELVLPLATTPARTTLTLLADGHTALVTIREDGPAVDAALRSQSIDGLEWSLVELPRHGLEVEVRSRLPLAGGSITTQAKRAAVRLSVAAHDVELVRHLATSLASRGPQVFAEPQLAAAERLVALGHLDEATIAYQEASALPILAPWAGLRLADVALLRSQRDAACASYTELARRYPERTVAVLASLRAHAATCSDAKDARQILEVHETWAATTENIARFLMDEAAWTVSQTDAPEGVAIALEAAFETPARARRWKRLHERWLARRVRAASGPAELLGLVERYRERVVAHPEAGDLLLRAARAAYALDLATETLELVREARRHGAQRGPAWAARAALAQLGALTVLAHRLAEDRPREAVATKGYVQHFGPLVAWAAPRATTRTRDELAPTSLAELERRLARAESALQAERRMRAP